MSLLTKLISTLGNKKKELEALNAQTKILSASITELTSAVIDELENQGLVRAESEEGILVTSIEKQVAKIVDKEKFCDFVFNTKNMGLVKSSISTAMLEEFAQDGKQIDGIEIIKLKKLSFRKA